MPSKKKKCNASKILPSDKTNVEINKNTNAEPAVTCLPTNATQEQHHNIAELMGITNVIETQMPKPQTIVCKVIPESEYNRLLTENTNLHAKLSQLYITSSSYYEKNKTLETEIAKRDQTIEELQKENMELKERIKKLEDEIINLKQDNKELTNEIQQLKAKNEKFDALVKLHECNANVNKNFKREYRVWFNKKKYEQVPNIGDFIQDSPDKTNDKDDYEFWLNFNKKYPRSNDALFRNLYEVVSGERCRYGAHTTIAKMSVNDFDKLANIVFDDYSHNKKLYDDYRDWLFMFPVV